MKLKEESPEALRSSHRWLKLEAEGRGDPVMFARHFLGLELHEGQKKYLRESIHKKHYILCPSNQWGKSFVVAILHIWANYYKYKVPGWNFSTNLKKKDRERLQSQLHDQESQTLNLSPRLRQAKLVYKYVIDILQSRMTWRTERANLKASKYRWHKNNCLIEGFLVSPMKVPHDTSISSTPIIFNNKARMFVASTGHDRGASIAGDQFCLISYDECGISNYLDEELGNYIWSRLVRFDGGLHLISTPDADSESYEYFRTLVENAEEEALKPDGDWGYQIGIMTENSFLDKKAIEKQKRQMEKFDPVMYRQVFQGEFVGSKTRFFNPVEVERIFDKEVNLLEPQQYHRYLMGADFAVSQNYTVFVTLDITEDDIWYLVNFVRFKGEKYTPQYQLELLADTSKRYHNAEIVYDASSLSGPFIEYSEQLDSLYTYPNKFDTHSKKQLLVALKKVLGYNKIGKIRAPHPTADNGLNALKRELHTYREKDRGRVKDCVMSLGMCAWRMEEAEKGGEVTPIDIDILAFS